MPPPRERPRAHSLGKILPAVCAAERIDLVTCELVEVSRLFAIDTQLLTNPDLARLVAGRNRVSVVQVAYNARIVPYHFFKRVVSSVIDGKFAPASCCFNSKRRDPTGAL